MMCKFEEHFAEQIGQSFDNEQWTRIWEASVSDSIEHILPQSSEKQHVHWLGNLLLLPPRLNSKLRDLSPTNKYLITTQAKRNLSSRSGIGGVRSAT